MAAKLFKESQAPHEELLNQIKKIDVKLKSQGITLITKFLSPLFAFLQ
jgi:hypothetical protein